MGGPGYCNGKMYNCFDNFFQCSFTVNWKKYTSTEQCYQASKFSDNAWHEKIRHTWNPQQAWALGQSTEHRLIPDFEKKKEELMYEANYAKFSQNDRLKQVLLSTGDGVITFVGSTGFWNAANGRILMRVRKELREKKNVNNK